VERLDEIHYHELHIGFVGRVEVSLVVGLDPCRR
jgi:hypothetical protein